MKYDVETTRLFINNHIEEEAPGVHIYGPYLVSKYEGLYRITGSLMDDGYKIIFKSFASSKSFNEAIAIANTFAFFLPEGVESASKQAINMVCRFIKKQISIGEIEAYFNKKYYASKEEFFKRNTCNLNDYESLAKIYNHYVTSFNHNLTPDYTAEGVKLDLEDYDNITSIEMAIDIINVNRY